jgi:predicted transcriptional regulator YdeE
MATVMVMADVTFDSGPARTLKAGVSVMLERTRDELAAIQQLWPRFEQLVGVRGRRMYAMVDTRAGTYAACTPVREGDDPARLGLDTAELPGGWYLRARIVGDPPEVYDRIAPAMQALVALAEPADPDRPLVEYYRRHNEIELWVPVPAQS